MTTVQVLDPTGKPPGHTESKGLAPRLTSLDGHTIGFLDNLKPGASHLLDAVRRHFEDELRLPTSYWEKKDRAGSSGPISFGEKLAEQTGAVINALGD